MRKAFPVSIPAGQNWPACAGGVGALTTRFSWIRIDNRGASDVLVAFNQVPINSPGEYWDYIPAGTKIVRNTGHKDGGVSDDLPHTLFISNIGTAPATLMVTIADAPINDARSGSSTGAGGAATSPSGTAQVSKSFTETPAPAVLAAAGVYTTNAVDLGGISGPGAAWKTALASVFSDVAGSWQFQISRDGVTWRNQGGAAAIAAGVANLPNTIGIKRFIRGVYTNGAAPQTIFEIDWDLYAI